MSSERTNSASSRKLVVSACAELERRLRSGEACRAEDFLSSQPLLADNPEAAVELIVTEFVVRRDLGEALDRSECYERFPQWRELLELKLASPPTLVSDSVADTEPPSGGPSGKTEPAAPLGKHEVYEQIGHGGMGLVYRARDLALGRDVALKRIRSGALVGTEVERFYREARAAALLRHPNIVPIYAVGLYDGFPCYTMPLMTGGTLAEHSGHYRRDTRAAVTLMVKVARAVHAAHKAGIVHRDLKPGNILLDEYGEPMVADFGLAKVLDGDAGMTRTDQAMGTLPYMAPEHVAGESSKANAASDVWALGVILYQLLTGDRPFGGKGRALEDRILKARPAWPGSLSRDLGAIVLKCLEKDQRHRYASAADLAADLEAWREGKPNRIPLQRRRRPWVLATTVAVLLALALAAGTMLLTHERDPDAAPAAELPPASNVWNPVLVREPRALRWPAGGKNSSRTHRPAAEELTLSCGEVGVLSLGQTRAACFQLSVTMRQNPWAGNIGLFFGYRDVQLDGQPGHVYQVVQLVSEPDGNDRFFRFYWMGVTDIDVPEPRQLSSRRIGVSECFRIAREDCTLAIKIDKGGLQAVSWKGGKLRGLEANEVTTPPGRMEYDGGFGVYVTDGSGVFRNAQFFFNEDCQ